MDDSVSLALISPAESERSSRLNTGYDDNRACRRPEILTDRVERERERERENVSFVPRNELRTRVADGARAYVHAKVRRRRSEVAEEAEDLSRRWFALTDLIRLGRGRCEASPRAGRPSVVPEPLSSRRHSAARSSSSLEPPRSSASGQTDNSDRRQLANRR